MILLRMDRLGEKNLSVIGLYTEEMFYVVTAYDKIEQLIEIIREVIEKDLDQEISVYGLRNIVVAFHEGIIPKEKVEDRLYSEFGWLGL